ncbi:MAG: DUF72 domain-containing protein [Xanthomonadales bacterium]|nr:DUF72 domain-containing protein [Xanthomonadales bacterium]MCC6595812.1 DUF72 domain-containing protein [Rhodanobacteraceae bacterium]MDL1868853.1 DUF72 domain-containing protein [Gammaproteobacteria bacterium PRO6]
MGNILVGTASWTDQTLIDCKRFYPRGCNSAEERLRHYASRFALVEVDSSYYALPSARNAALWAQRTPAGFTFNVKAFRALTQHQTPRQALPRDLAALLPAGRSTVYYKDLPGELREELWTRFVTALQPLAEAGKLGALHFQFPPWFIARRENYQYLEHLRERLPQHLLAVEFRHASWFAPAQRDATLEFERAHALANVTVDEPQGFRQSIPAVWEITTPALALLRLHGRNADTWTRPGLAAASDRFNYDYPSAELAQFVPRLRSLAASAALVHVVFNNNYEDQGVRNARELIDLLGADAAGPAPA